MTRTVWEERSSKKPGCRGATLVAVALALAFLGLVPAVASAQKSGFTGTVTDTSGGVLPGVTVEAASPALIEKVRTVVTDSRGRYSIVDLRPGVYSVTFSLVGFGTVLREGIQLAGGFTATVNAELPVGSIQEVVVVKGGAPTVDLRNTAKQTTLSKELLDAVPSGGTAQYYTTLLLGVSQLPESVAAPTNNYRWSDLTFHGMNEHSIQLDGFDTSHRLSGDGAIMMLNSGMTQEIVVSKGSGGPDQQSGGLVTNMIPRSGGNTFSGTFSTYYANKGLTSDNVTAEMKARGVGSQTLKETWDFNPAFGGPIKRDRLWFWTSYRNMGNKVSSGQYRDVDPLDWVYTPDKSQPTDAELLRNQNYSLRLTWQANQRNNISMFGDIGPLQWQNRGGRTAASRADVAPEATLEGNYRPMFLVGVSWKSAVNDRLYLEGGASVLKNRQWFNRTAHDADTGKPVSPDLNAVAAEDLNTGYLFRGSSFIGNFNNTQADRIRGSASYITGGHTFKVGGDYLWGSDQAERNRVGDYIVRVRSGVPVNIQVWGPENRTSRMTAWDIHATDQWVIKRATLNLGVRYDYQKTGADAQTLPANSMLPQRSFPKAVKINHFHDLSPRLGFSYDLFGNNRTALKATLNRYVTNLESAQSRAPSALAVTNTTRDWTDTNKNFVPDCDFKNFEANGECSRLANMNFGSVSSNITQFDPIVDGGLWHRGYNWEISTGVQHHVAEGLGVQVSYYRRWWRNQTVTDNLLVASTDYSPFCVRTPADSRLPGGGGQEMCGYFDLSPTKIGVVQNRVTLAKNFGNQMRIYSGIEVSLSARLGNGLQLDGGLSSERIATESCYTVDSPQQVFCKNTPPFRTTLKLLGVYPLPWGVQVSGAYQGIPGPALNGARVFSRSEILGLDRLLSTSTVTVTIVEPNSAFAPYVHKLDLRLSKIFRVRTRRITGSLDVMNVTNNAGALAVNTVVGPDWQKAVSIPGGRVFRFSARFDF